MTTEAATTTTATSSESLSPAEMAYFNSGGTDTEAVEKEYGGALDLGSKPEPTAAPEAKQPDATDEDDDEEVTVGPDGKPRDASGKYVSHQALHKERVRRKAAETEVLTYREKMARADERLAVLNEFLSKQDGTAPATQAAKAPDGKPAAKAAEVNPLDEEPIDPEQDVFAALKQAQRQNKELLRRMTTKDESEKTQATENSFATAYRSDAQAFVAKTPDFKDAYVYLIEGLHKEMEAMGVTDVAARNAAIAQQEKDFVRQAMAAKKSPSEALYAVAKTRGYAGKAAAPATNSDASRLESVKRGQSAVVSLTKAGGSSSDGLTLESLAGMSEEEFSRTLAKLSKTQRRELMGG